MQLFAKVGVVLAFLLWSQFCSSQSYEPSILCRAGSGNFDAAFHTGVSAHVGAVRSSGGETLATRGCTASLDWDKRQVVVSDDASEIDLDAFGADVGLSGPVAAFQVKKLEDSCCTEYRIYSLQRPPRLLTTLTGGDFFSASDTDLDGRVEIWTHDAAAVDGLEKLTLGEMDFPPTVVFRFAHGQLVDVSAEFRERYDTDIAKIKADVRPQDVENFKNSDGQLREAGTPASIERLHYLRATKVKVLEIVWAYLYSGREQAAWDALAKMWPTADIDRIHNVLLKARSQGVRNQAQNTSMGSQGKKKHAQIFQVEDPFHQNSSEVIPPQPILLERSSMSAVQAGTTEEEALLNLVIDAAGKVRSVQPATKSASSDGNLIEAASGWKFVPAFKDGKPVASRLRINVAPSR
jgi:hypothetical protein